jgi:hypothetical protein
MTLNRRRFLKKTAANSGIIILYSNRHFLRFITAEKSPNRGIHLITNYHDIFNIMTDNPINSITIEFRFHFLLGNIYWHD